MGSASEVTTRPHAVCIPYPAQGHVTPMLHLAKLLHHHAGFHITFVNSNYNRRRLVASRGAAALDGFPGFRFESIPDGLEAETDTSSSDSTQDIPSLCQSTMVACLQPFSELLARLNEDSTSPPVSCIVSDAVMSFTLDAARELGVPDVLFWTPSACSLMAYLHYKHLIQRGVIPLKVLHDLENSKFMESPINWIPGLNCIRFRDMPSFVRTTDPEDVMINFAVHVTQKMPLASGILINTFHDLEEPVLHAMAAATAEELLMECKQPLPSIFPVGPLHILSDSLLSKDAEDPQLAAIGSNLWKEDDRCLQWLEGRLVASGPRSVVYVNFGSITVMTNAQLVQFAWGLAGSSHDFLWVIRPDLVRGDSAVLPKEFVEETEGRGLLATWSQQEEVLGHPAVGCFLTHSGWNSTIESIASGVPMLCWPFFADQQTNCHYACAEWGVAVEIGDDVSSKQLGELIKEVMVGEKGAEMRKRAEVWRDKAVAGTRDEGSSFASFQMLVRVLLEGNTCIG